VIRNFDCDTSVFVMSSTGNISGTMRSGKNGGYHSGQELPDWGNLRRVRPFSEHYGFDRGTPIDRYYLNKFLEQNRAWITGDVLEIQMTGYTSMFGTNVRRSDSIDIDPQHGTTYVCDLASSEAVVPSNAYDCFLMPNTLHHLRNLEASLSNALRLVRPGGVLLATTTSFVPVTPDFLDYWRLTPAGWQEVTERVWRGCEIRIATYGNALAATAAMLGLAHEELSPEELDVQDPRYPVLITVFCRKPKNAAR
jgi:hypothetical protein